MDYDMYRYPIFLLVIVTAFFAANSAFARDGRLDRCEPFRIMVCGILEDEGVSSDYYYLMVAESGCRIGAVSNRGAVGFWQLMPATARHYGCSDASNLVCSTRAAAKYIRSLSARFPNFDDVIRAYNQGGHNYKRNGATNESNGLVFTVLKLQSEDG